MRLPGLFRRTILSAALLTVLSAPLRAAVAPSAVTNLRVLSIVSTGLGASSMTVTLAWTSPGEEGVVGNLFSSTFTIKYSSTTPILDDAGFGSANFTLNIATNNVVPGSLQSVSIPYLNAAASYYFMLKTTDTEKLSSAISIAATAQAYVLTFYDGNGLSHGIAMGDSDGDGDADFAEARFNNGVHLFRNDGNGAFTDVVIPGGTSNAEKIAWGDYDNDGKLDLVVANTGGVDEQVFHNDGGNVFTLAASTGLGTTYDVVWGDYNNDGRLDFAAANGAGENEYVARSNMDGSFSTFTIAGSGGDSRGIAWGDYDNDGYLDLAIANFDANVAIARNNGNGTFSTSTVAGSGAGSLGVAWGDYDGDGDLDLAVAKNGADLVLLRNDGGGVFTPLTLAGTGGVNRVSWADYDNDGDLDLVAPGVIFRNDGGGTFTKISLAGVGGDLRDAVWADFNGDNSLDVAIATRSSVQMALLRNDAALTHSAPAPPSSGFSASFQEYGVFSSSGLLTIKWNEGFDVQTPAAQLHYEVRMGTTPGGGESLRIPRKNSESGKSFFRSDRVAPAQRGLKLVMQKESTAYWAVVTEDSEFQRSAESAEQTAYIVAPGRVTDLRVASIVSTGLGASSMTVTLQWTAPGDNGYSGALAGGTFDIRYSTLSPITGANAYAAAPFTVSIATTAAAGELQTYIISNLDVRTSHYFTITTKDSLGVRSGLSNLNAIATGYILLLPGTSGSSPGAAWGDYDRDGDLDLLLSDNRLMRNDGNGNFTQVAIPGMGGRGVAWADYDNDGDLDIVSGAPGGADEVVLRNDGGDIFTQVVLTGSAGSSNGVAWGDYLNSGRPGLAVANYNGENEVLARNNGNGTFSTATLAGTAGWSQGIAWGDYDNDGDLDLAVGNLIEDPVLLRNNGNGSFTVTSAFSLVGAPVTALAWGDYNKDGYLDLALARSGSADESILRNNGNGTFTQITLTGSGGDSQGIAWGDYDNDGDLDLAVANSGGENEVILRNNGNGTFSKFVLGGTAGNSTGVSWGDFDGDGDLDLAVASNDKQVMVLRNDAVLVHTNPSAPSSGFSASFQEYDAASSSGVLTLQWGSGSDVEDSTATLRYFVRVGTTVAASSTTYKIPPRFSADGFSGGGSFLYSTKVSSAARGMKLVMQKETTVYWGVVTEDSEFQRSAESAEQTAYIVAPGRVTDLRVAGIVSTGLGASSMTVTLQWTAPGDNGYSGALAGAVYDIRYSTLAPLTSANAYLGAAFALTISTTANAGELQTALIQFLEAKATHYFAITVKDSTGIRSLLSNPAAAEAYVRYPVASSGSSTAIAWGDYDGDGDLDAIVANTGGEDEFLLRNDGGGVFTKIVLTGTGGNSTAVAWGDYDNDGDLDAIVTNSGGQDEYLLRNNGTSFSSAAIVGSGGDSYGVAWGDYDNDGDLDAIVANGGAEDEFLLRNDGNGVFTKIVIGGSGGNSTAVAWGDYDNDGDLDAIVANAGGENEFLLRNDGGGIFTKVIIPGSSGNSRGVAWGDYDNDGDLDAIVANAGGEDKILLRNDGGGVFTKIVLAGSGADSQGIAFGDYDGDGDLDAAAADGSAQDEIFLRNDVSVAHNAPSAPTSGFSASFQEYGIFATSGVLTLSWGNGSDTETPAAALRYFVRVGTTVAGSSTTLKVPRRLGLSGSSLYSTRTGPATQGIKVVMQKETTVYWGVTAVDGESSRSAESVEQSARLAAPAAVADLAAAQDNTVETSSSAWMTLTWTAPGEDGNSSALQPGSLYDIRWSTVGVVDSQAKYEALPNQLVAAADGQSPGAVRSQFVAVPAGKTYYFALTTKDSLGSRSGLSNAPAGVSANSLLEDTTGVAVPTALQGDTTAFLRVKLWVNSGSLTWTKLGVRKTGGLPDSAIKNVAVYQDSNANGVFDAADAFALRTSPAVFVSSAVTLTLSPAQTINTSTRTYFVALQFEAANLQADGSSVSVRLDPQPFTVRGAGIPATDLPGLLLDGTDDRVRVPASASLNSIGALAVEAWVRTTDAGVDRSIVTRANVGLTNGFRLWLNGAGCGGGVPTLLIGSAFLCANRAGVPVRVDDGNWHHVAGAYNDLDGKRMFVDGEMLSTGPVSSGVLADTSDMAFGGPNPNGGNFLTGIIDEVRVSNFMRYAAGFVPALRNSTDGGTVLLYHFDALVETGTFVQDASANGNSGTILGGAAGYGRSTSTVLIDVQDILESSGTDISPATMYRNAANVGLLRLQLWTNHDYATLRRISVGHAGSGSEAGITNIRMFKDDGDGLFSPVLDTSLTTGQDFTVGKATFDLAAVGQAQVIMPSTQTFFFAWDITGAAQIGESLGLLIGSTGDILLSGTTDAVSTLSFPIQTATRAVVAASAFVAAETSTGAWVNVSSIVFNGNFNLGNVNHFHPRWDQSPATPITGTEPIWNTGKSTTTATADGNNWYFHVRAFDASDTPGTQQDLGPFFVDRTPPSSSGFGSFNSTGGLLAQSQINDLALGVTVQLNVQDVLSGLSLGGPAPLAPVQGTVGLWHFDDPSGTVWNDSETAGMNLTGAGVVTRAAGRFRTGLLFDGFGSLSNTSPVGLPTGASARSIEAWVNPASTQTTLGLLTWGAAGAGTLMRFGMINGKLATDTGGSSDLAGPVLSTGVWQHAALTYDGSAARYFLNGVFIGSHTYGPVATTAGTLYVGAGEGATLKFKGVVDEARILNRALSPNEVYNDYSRGNPYYAAYSTSAGNSWQLVLSTSAGSGPWIARTGSAGSTGVETLALYGIDLIVSTSNAIGAQATNQALFFIADTAGNVHMAGPFGVLVDTNAAVAVSTAISPMNGVYTGPRPNFDWAGPSTASVAALAGPGGNGGRFYLQAASNDPGFSPGNIVLSVSTPAFVADTSLSRVVGVYQSTFTLAQGATYYWRVRSMSSLGVFGPWSAANSFVVDASSPAGSAYLLFNSSGGTLAETQYTDILRGVTAQMTFVDGLAGFPRKLGFNPDAGTLALWHFNERDGSSPLDVSTNAVAGTLIGINASSAVYRATPFGAGLRCDGAQAMTAPSTNVDFSTASDFTFEAWINPDSVSGIQILGGVGSVTPPYGNWLLRIDNSKLYFTNALSAGFATLPGVVAAGAWQHVAMTARGSKISFYVNGVLNSSGGSGANSGSYGKPFALCAAIGNTGVYENPYTGLIDEVRILNYEASAQQIAADYAATAGGLFSVEYSTTAGNTWAVVSATAPASGYAYLSFPGAEGGLGPDTLAVRDMALTHSTTSAVGSAATNQVRFIVPDRAGNFQVTGPFAVLVDTLAATAVSTPSYPVGGAYAQIQTNFLWAGPSTKTASGMGASSAAYVLEVDDAPDFSTPEISISTPVVLQSTSALRVFGSYTSTFTLADNTTFYWRVMAQDFLGQRSPPLTSGKFVTDLSSPTYSNFGTFDSTGGFTAESGANNLLAGATAQLTVQDAGPSGLRTGLLDGNRTFGVVYTTGGNNPAASVVWNDGGMAEALSDAAGTRFTSLAVFQGRLYAGMATGGLGGKVYSYDGSVWSGPDPFANDVLTLTGFQGKLYAGLEGGEVWGYDGALWTRASSLPANRINALAEFNGRLYAATGSQGRIYAYDPAVPSWYESYKSTNTEIFSLEVYNGRLFAGGNPTIYAFSGSTWTPAFHFQAGGNFYDLQAHNGKLYAATNNQRIFTYDGTAWTFFNSPENEIRSLGVHQGRLYFGASLPSIGRIYTHDGKDLLRVRDLATNNDRIFAFKTFQDRLYLGAQSGAGPAKVYVSTPLAVSLTGGDAVTSPQTLQATGLNFIASVNGVVCGGSSPCLATNQLRFTVSDMAGNVRQAGPFSVLVDPLIVPSTAVYPADGSFVRASSPIFTWAEINGMTTHQVQVSSVSSFANLSVDKLFNTYALASPMALEHGTTYYWRIRSQNPAGIYSAYSKVKSFAMDLARPTTSAFRHISSSGGALGESQFNSLASGITVQIDVQDAFSGLDGGPLRLGVDLTAALYPFDEGEGNYALPLSGGNRLAFSGTPSWAPGLYGKAVKLDGTNTLYSDSAPELPIGNSARTIEAWVYPVDSNGGGILQYGNLMRLSINGSCATGTASAGNAKLCLDAAYSGDYAFAPNQWHHVAFTYDGNGNGALFADGVQLTSFAQAFATPGGPVVVGTATACGAFNGRIDELRILSKGLSAAEVEADYRRAGSFRAEISTTAGQSWETVAATVPANGRYLSLSGAPGSAAVETLTLYHAGLPESTTTLKGAGGTNQIKFTVSDRAGNEVMAGPYTILKDTTVLQPSLFWMVPLSTQSIYLVASATDDFSGVKDFQFEISSSPLFNSSVSTSPWVKTATYTFTGLLNSTTYFARVRARDNLLNVSIPSALDKVGGYSITAATSTFGSVYYATAPAAPGSALQGAYVPMVRFTLRTPPGALSKFFYLRVRKTGNTADSSIIEASIHTDTNNDGVFQSSADVRQAGSPLIGGIAFIKFSPEASLADTQTTFYVALRLKSDAPPGETVGLDILQASDFGLQFPSSPEGPFPTSAAPIPISDGVNDLTFTGASIAPLVAQPNDKNVQLLRMQAQTNNGTSIINSITFNLKGTLPSTELKSLTLWRDKNGDGSFDPAVDEAISSRNDAFAGGVSTVALTAQISSRTASVTPSIFFLSADILPTAPQGGRFRVEFSTANVTLANALDIVKFSGAGTIASSTCTVQQNNTVTISTADAMPVALFQGESYTVLKLSALVDVGVAELNRLQISAVGTGQDTDVKGVSAWMDQTADGGPLNPLTDVFLGSSTFSAGLAKLDIATTTLSAGTTYVFFITYDISPGASPGRTLGAKLTNASYIGMATPLSAVVSSFPVVTATALIQATTNSLRILYAEDKASGGMDQGASDVPMLRFDLVSSKNNFSWQGVVVDRVGTAQDSDVKAVKVWRDNGDGVFSVSADSAITNGLDAFLSGQANVALTIPQTISLSTQIYFITLSASPSAVPGRTVGLRVATTASLVVNYPNEVSTRTAAFPLASGLTPINQFANTVAVTTVSVVPALGAEPGTQNVGMMSLEMRTNVSSARWFILPISQIGTAPDTDLGDVKVYYDVSNVGFFNSANLSSYVLIASTGQRFGQNGPKSVRLAFASPPTLGPSPQRFFVTVDLSTAAKPENTVKLRTNVSAGEPGIIESPNTLAISFESQPLNVNPPPTLMYVLATSSAPGSVNQGDSNVPILTLKAWMAAYTGQWTQLAVSRWASGLDSDVSGVKLFYDSNDNGVLDVTSDQRLSTASFLAGTATLGFSTQTIRVTTQTYFLTYDISITAGGGNGVSASLGAPGVFTLAAPHGVSSLGFPIQSASATVKATQTKLFALWQAKAPGQLVQSATNQVMLTLELYTTQYALLWSGLSVQRTGTASDSDITAVHVWTDGGTYGVIDPGDKDITSGLNSFLAGSAGVSLVDVQTIGTAHARYLVTVDIAPFADPAKTFGLSVATASAFTLNSPNVTEDQNFPMTVAPVPLRKLPENLVVTPRSLMPAGVNQGQESTAAKLLVRASRDRVTWTRMKLAKAGSIEEVGVREVRIVKDLDGSGAVSSGDLIIGNGTFSSGVADIVFSAAQTVTASTATYFVTMVLDSSATVDALAGFILGNETFFTVGAPDGAVLSGTAFATSLGKVLDSKTPLLPVVTVDGPMSSQFEHLHFVWNSTVAFGSMTGAWYAVGTDSSTDAGRQNVLAYSVIPVTAVDFKGVGFPLKSGTTYYVSVKTQSSFGFFSPVGISQGVLMDFTVPPVPAPAVTAGQAAVLVSWGTVGGGPSGIAGYLVEYRKGDSPVWYNAKTKKKSGVASVASARADIRVAEVVVSTDELVTGGSFQGTDLPSGTLYVRVRSVTGSGVASAPSEPIKVQVGALPKEGISKASNYPNPFDSRKRGTIIVYTLSANADMSLKIYDVFGRLVREIGYGAGAPGGQAGTNEVNWDGTDAGGRKVSKGMYLAVLQSGGAKVVLKIGVIH